MQYNLKYVFLTICLALLYSNKCLSQIDAPQELVQHLKNKTNFYDIKKTVESYYYQKLNDSASKKTNSRQLKFWNRWFEENESRLMPDGTVADAANIKLSEVFAENFQRTNATSSQGDWLFKGPSSVSSGIGRVNRVAFHPTDPNIVYAGTANGGLWKLTHIANLYNWTNITPGLPTLGISGIVISHNDPNTIYILTGDGDAVNSGGYTASWGYASYSVGVLKSTDGGNNWFQTSPLPIPGGGSYAGFKLVQDPINPNKLFAATTRGLYKTTDGGVTWGICEFIGSYNDRRCFDVEIQPSNPNIVMASFNYLDTFNSNWVETRIFRSINGGDQFSKRFVTDLEGEPDVNRIELEFSKSNPSVIYALSGPGNITPTNTSNDTYKGLFKSTDAGISWTRTNNSPDILAYRDIINDFKHQSSYDLALTVSPTNSNRVITGGLVAWRTENSGTNMTEIVDYFEDIDNSNYIHPDIHDLAYNPLNNRLYAATDGGVCYSEDHGDNWIQLFSGIGISQFYHFEAENEDGYSWGGSQDNGVILEQSNGSFYEFSGGDGYDVLTDKVGNSDDSYWIINNKIYADGVGPLPINITPQGKLEFFPLLEMHANSEDILYAGYSDFLWVSNDRGDNWTTRSPSSRWAIGVCPSNSPRLYVAGKETDTVNVLWRIENVTNEASHTLHQITTGLYLAGYPSGTPKITSISVNPANSNQLWVTVGGYTNNVKVFFSGDAGATFINISAGLPNVPVFSSITDANGNTYIGTEIGVYYRNNNMTSWTPFYNGLPRVPVTDLDFKTIIGIGTKYLYASTYGRGIWYTEVYGDCENTINVSSSLTGQHFFQAGQTISTSSTVHGGIGSEVIMRSGNNVTHTEGFTVNAGSTYRAYTGPCNSGMPVLNRTAPDTIQNKQLKNKKIVPARILEIVHYKAFINCHTEGNYQLLIIKNDSTTVTIKNLNLVKGKNEINFQSDIIENGAYILQLVKDGEKLNMQELYVN